MEDSFTFTFIDFGGDFSLTEMPCHDDKLFESHEHSKKRFRSAPNTPEKQTRGIRTLTKKANTGSVVKNFSQISAQSPLHKEAYGILYPDLPPLEPSKKLLTPQKFKEKTATPAKKCLFAISRRDLFKRVFSNTIVVANIFRYLSDGDLYRLSMVSRSLRDSLELDVSAYERYRRFSRAYEYSKENYRITPPKSPRRDDGLAEQSTDSKNFSYFCDVSIGTLSPFRPLLIVRVSDRQHAEQEPVVGEVSAVPQGVRGGELHRAVPGRQRLRLHLLPEVRQLRQRPRPV